MAGNKTADTDRNAVGSKREAVEKGFGSGRRFVSNGYDAARRYATTGYDAARQYANRSYEASRQYTKSGIDFAARMGANLNELARKQPVIAMATVLAVGLCGDVYGAPHLHSGDAAYEGLAIGSAPVAKGGLAYEWHRASTARMTDIR